MPPFIDHDSGNHLVAMTYCTEPLMLAHYPGPRLTWCPTYPSVTSGLLMQVPPATGVESGISPLDLIYFPR